MDKRLDYRYVYIYPYHTHRHTPTNIYIYIYIYIYLTQTKSYHLFSQIPSEYMQKKCILNLRRSSLL